MQKEEKQNRREAPVFLWIGILMLLSELWKQYILTYRVYGGAYCFSFIPFQLCSVAMYIALILGIWEMFPARRQKAGDRDIIRDILLEFLSTFTLLGGVIVFLDTSGMFYPLPELTAHSFIWHFVLIFLGLYAGKRKRRCDAGTFAGAAGIYLVCCVIAELINLSLDKYDFVNMFYINPHYDMVQIGFSSLNGLFPNNLVIGIYILATVLGAALMHLIWRVMEQQMPPHNSTD